MPNRGDEVPVPTAPLPVWDTATAEHAIPPAAPAPFTVRVFVETDRGRRLNGVGTLASYARASSGARAEDTELRAVVHPPAILASLRSMPPFSTVPWARKPDSRRG